MSLPDKFNFSATPEQATFILPILEAVYLGFKDLKAEGGGGVEKELGPKRKGKLKIKLMFFGYTAAGKKKQIESTFRLMQENPQTISLQRLQAIGTKIHQKFDSWQHTTGRILACYSDWDKGYQLQLQVKDRIEGKRIVEQILDIQSHSPKWEYLTFTENADPDGRYSTIPEKVTLANQSIRPPAQRSIATVKFTQALIKFPHITQYTHLCDQRGNVIKNLDFLKNYDD